MHTFWFHYNKPLSKEAGINILTIHWKGKCHFVHNIRCTVPIWTHSQKQQPRCILKGKATNIDFSDGSTLATIT